MHHMPLDMNMLIDAPAVTHGARIAVMCRPASPDPGAALPCNPLEYKMWQQAQQQRVEHAQEIYLACSQTMPIIAESLLTSC